MIAAIFDQLGLALLREVPRVAVVDKNECGYSDSYSPAAACVATSKTVIPVPCNRKPATEKRFVRSEGCGSQSISYEA